MPDLKDFHVDEKKVWFTGGYWPEGVPHQLADIEDINVMPLTKSIENAIPKMCDFIFERLEKI